MLCVDMDPQGNLTMSQGIDPDTLEKSMYDVLVHKTSIREVIRRREVDIACASIDLAGAEIAMSTMIGRERSLQKAFEPIREDYDFICIDTPPSLGLLTINALTAADKVIVPVQCEYLSMRGLIQLQNTLAMIRENLNPDVDIEGILPTLVDSRTIHAKEAIEILEENFGDRVFASRIRKTVRFAEAPVKGMSVLRYEPEGVAAQSYRELAHEVLAHGSKEIAARRGPILAQSAPPRPGHSGVRGRACRPPPRTPEYAPRKHAGGPLAALFRKTEEDGEGAVQPTAKESAEERRAGGSPSGRAPSRPTACEEPAVKQRAAKAGADRGGGPPPIPSPRERLRNVFSAEIPANVMERPSRRARRRGARPAPPVDVYAREETDRARAAGAPRWLAGSR